MTSRMRSHTNDSVVDNLNLPPGLIGRNRAETFSGSIKLLSPYAWDNLNTPTPSLSPSHDMRNRSISLSHSQQLGFSPFSPYAGGNVVGDTRKRSVSTSIVVGPNELSPYTHSRLGLPQSPQSVIDNDLNDNNFVSQAQLSQLSALLPMSPLPTPNYSSNHTVQTPTRSLWIGNIDPTLSAADLLSLFNSYGNIESLRILPDKECAFVNYCSVEEAIRAKERVTGIRIGRSNVKVGFGKVDEGGVAPTKSLWIGNIPPTTNPTDLETLFGQFGTVESARVLTHKNCGFVNFITIESAIEARKQMNGLTIFGSTVKIGFAKVPDDPKTPIVPIVSNDDELEISEDSYYSHVAVIPTSKTRKIEQNRLREIRKRLEGHCTPKDVENMWNECLDECVELCVDYIGNVVIQKLMEKTTDAQRQTLIERIAPYLSAIGIHKNGTWAAQKMIECARTPLHMQTIASHIQPYTPPLLLDQFGNYVIQCCLKLGQYNQFIFDAMHNKCFEIGQGRYGARAMRTILESQYATKRQQKHVSISIVKNAVALSVNANGCLLVGWLVDMSGLSGRYRVLAPKMGVQVGVLAVNKLSSGVILKIINQTVELDAREVMLKEIFFSEDGSVLTDILSDTYTGVPLILKIITLPSTSPEEKTAFSEKIRNVLSAMNKSNEVGYKRLVDEVSLTFDLYGPKSAGYQNLNGFAKDNVGYGVNGYVNDNGGYSANEYRNDGAYSTGYNVGYGGNGYGYNGFDEEYMRMMVLENGI